MKVLVTGGAGFVGSHVCSALLARGDQVVAIDNFNDFYSPKQKRENIVPLLNNPKFQLLEADIRERDRLMQAFADAGFDCVVHCAAMANVRYSLEHPDQFASVNVTGTSNLLEAASKHRVSRFVFASTSSVYGERQDFPFLESDRTDFPLAPYPATKKAGELLGHAFHTMCGLNFIALRFFNVYGPAGRPDMMPYRVMESIHRGEEIALFDGGEMFRDWTYVDDIVSGVIAAVDRVSGYQIINLGRGEPVSMTEFMRITEELAGKKALVRSVPAPKTEPKKTFASVKKANEILGYRPEISLRQGLEHFWEWYKKSRLN